MKKIANGFCVVLGFVFLGIGAVGVVLPVLPTTPFLLLAGILFAKGSERFHRWFLNTKLYKNHLEDFVVTKTMTRKSKISILATVSVLFTIGFLIAPIWHAKAAIAAAALGHYYYFIFRIRTVGPDEKQQVKPTCLEEAAKE